MTTATKAYGAELGHRLMYLTGARPTIWQLPNPLKIVDFEALTDGAQIMPGQRVLDIGSGRGIQAQLLARRGCYVVGIDPSEKHTSNARRELRFSRVRRRVTFVCGTLETAPASEPFDHAFSFSVLEHIAELDRTLAHLHKLLKPGANFHLTVDALANVDDQDLIERHRREYRVERYFTPETLTHALERAGFEVASLDYILRSRIAVGFLEKHLRTGVATHPPAARRREYAELVAAERTASGGGLMIACRARRI